jgi:tetratricopeptide (TPR) repeat protein
VTGVLRRARAGLLRWGAARRALTVRWPGDDARRLARAERAVTLLRANGGSPALARASATLAVRLRLSGRPAEAEATARAALAMCADGPANVRAHAGQALAEALLMTGSHGEAHDVAIRAVADFDSGPTAARHPEWLAGSLYTLGRACEQQGRIDDALASCERSLAALRTVRWFGKLRAVELEIFVTCLQTRLFCQAGRFAEAVGSGKDPLELLDLAQKLGRSHDTVRLRAELLMFLAYSHGEVGDLDLGLARARLSLEAYRRLGDEHDLAKVFTRLAEGFAADARPDQAAAAYGEAISILTETAATVPDDRLFRLVEARSDVLGEAGRCDEAVDLTAAVLPTLRRWVTEQQAADLVNVLVTVADRAREAGRDPAGILGWLDEAAALAQDLPPGEERSYVLYKVLNTRSMALGYAVRHEEAADSAGEAVEHVRELVAIDEKYRVASSVALNHYGHRLADVGRLDEAAGAGAEALAVARRHADEPVGRRALIFALETMARVHQDRHDHQAAIDALTEAITLARAGEGPSSAADHRRLGVMLRARAALVDPLRPTGNEVPGGPF